MPDPIALTSNPAGVVLAVIVFAVALATKGLND